jgi:excisionase family DNA binding protein
MVTTRKKPQSKLLSVREAALYLDKSYETVAYALKTGQLPYREFGQRRLIPLNALDKWLQESDEPEADR